MDTPEFRHAVRARDRDAWARLYATYAGALCRQAGQVLPVDLDPEDAVQDTWARALSRAGAYDPALAVFPWLSRICLNVCLNLVRARRLRRWIPLPPRARARAAAGPGARDAREAAGAALLRLRGRRRQIVVLRFLFGLSTREVAEVMGMSTARVRWRLFRALESLRSGLSPAQREAWRLLIQGEGA